MSTAPQSRAHTEVSAVSPEEWEAWRSFFAMRRQLDRALDRALQLEAGISAPDYEVLLILFESDHGRLRAGTLSDLLGWEKSRLSHQVTRMTARELVERRECDDDGRGTWIAITADGKRIVLRAMRDHARRIREYFFDALAPGQLEVLGDASRRILDAIDAPVCREFGAT